VRDISEEETMIEDSIEDSAVPAARALGCPRGGGEELLRADDSCEERAEPAQLSDERGMGRRNQRGMVSAEWAVGIIAAVAIAGVLLGIVTSGPIHDALLKFILLVIQSFAGFLR
jgi:Protein of unknown function (DUF4244)